MLATLPPPSVIPCIRNPLVVAVFGGSFNPPSRAHTILAREILYHRLADKIIILPCGDGRADKVNEVPGHHRLEMAFIAMREEFGEPGVVEVDSSKAIMVDLSSIKANVVVDAMEVATGWMPTFMLMRGIRAKYINPQSSLKFKILMGSDLLASIRGWIGVKELWAENEFLIYYRHSAAAQLSITDIDRRMRVTDIIRPEEYPRFCFTNISSSEIRQRLQDNCGFGIGCSLLSSHVFNYIKEQKLYSMLKSS
jgi:nicotinate (nicotinamide) nucleotide adenylyltransferase